MFVMCDVDGQPVKSMGQLGTKMRFPEGLRWDIKDHRLSANEVQRLMFAKPVSAFPYTGSFKY